LGHTPPRVAEANPLKQGLKPALIILGEFPLTVAEANPLKQGLKLPTARCNILF